MNPALTSVRLHAEILGEEATTLLIEQCKGTLVDKKRVFIDSELVIRESTAVAREFDDENKNTIG